MLEEQAVSIFIDIPCQLKKYDKQPEALLAATLVAACVGREMTS